MRSINLNINDPDLAGIGKFGISGSNNEGQAADFYFSATLNGNVIYAETVFASAIADTDPYSDYSTFDLATDASNGNFMSGEYVVNIIAKQAGGSTVLNTYTETFNFAPYNATSRVQSLNLTNSIDCVQGFFTIIDSTTYPTTGITQTRAWTITPPTIMGSTGAIINGTSDFVKIFFTHTNVVYQVAFETSLSYEIASGGDIDITETHELSSNFNYTVDCDNNLGEISQCVYNELNRLKGESCRLGGFDKLNSSDRAKWECLIHELTGWHIADATLDADSKATYYQNIVNLLGCECETDDEVKPFILPDGSSQVQTAWEEVVTVFLNSFLNGPKPLRWRVTKDNELRIFGEIQIPSGLSAGVPVVVTTGFVSASLLTDMIELESPCHSVAGMTLGSLRLDKASTDLEFTPNANYSAIEFMYVNLLLPLD